MSRFYSSTYRANRLSRTSETTSIAPIPLFFLAAVVIVIIHIILPCPCPSLLIATVNRSAMAEECRQLTVNFLDMYPDTALGIATPSVAVETAFAMLTSPSWDGSWFEVAVLVGWRVEMLSVAVA